MIALVVAGCGDLGPYAGPPGPIGVDRSTGAVLVQVAGPEEATSTAVLDVLAPLTIVDRGAVSPRRDTRALTLYGRADDSTWIPRAELTGAVLDLSPCGAAVPCVVGEPVTAIANVLGADLFDTFGLRLRLGQDEIELLPPIAGSDTLRGDQCDAVFPSAFAGGGTLAIAGTELRFDARRLVLSACLAPDPSNTTDRTRRGADAILGVSTAFAPIVLSASAYERYRRTQATPPPELTALTAASVQTPGGPVSGGLASLPAISLVGESPRGSRGGCEDVFAHHFLQAGSATCPSDGDCPCEDGRTCTAPAILTMVQSAQLQVVVVADDTRLLQDLRAELRPDRGELDGVIGTEALALVELDLDYPHQRALGRCADATTCRALPRLASPEAATALSGCW